MRLSLKALANRPARHSRQTPHVSFHTFRLSACINYSTIEPTEPTNRPQTLSRLKPPTTSSLIRREQDLLQFLRMGTCSHPLAVPNFGLDDYCSAQRGERTSGSPKQKPSMSIKCVPPNPPSPRKPQTWPHPKASAHTSAAGSCYPPPTNNPPTPPSPTNKTSSPAPPASPSPSTPRPTTRENNNSPSTSPPPAVWRT